MDRMIVGENLTFTATGTSGSVIVSNYIDPVDLGGSLPDGF